MDKPNPKIVQLLNQRIEAYKKIITSDAVVNKLAIDIFNMPSDNNCPLAKLLDIK